MSNRRWTAAQDAILTAGYEGNRKVAIIAHEVGRSVDGCKRRADFLGIKHARTMMLGQVEQVNITLLASEVEELKREAAKAGTTLSAIARGRLFGKKGKS